jgi:hypothetical protein
MKECIITEEYNCPHEIISGKICSSCKIPDTTEECIILKMVMADEDMCSLCGQKEVEEIHITTLNGRGEPEPMGVCKECWQKYTARLEHQEKVKRAIAYLKHYIDTYDKQVGYLDYSDDCIINDILYGLGVALDPKEYLMAPGYNKFKERLKAFLNQ